MSEVNLLQLQRELEAAGVPVPKGLGTSEWTLETVFTYGDDGMPIPLPPEADPVLAAHDPTKPQRSQDFEVQEDLERMTIINERAAQDPAFAALVELTLGPG